jgi:hypothetical protein
MRRGRAADEGWRGVLVDGKRTAGTLADQLEREAGQTSEQTLRVLTRWIEEGLLRGRAASAGGSAGQVRSEAEGYPEHVGGAPRLLWRGQDRALGRPRDLSSVRLARRPMSSFTGPAPDALLRSAEGITDSFRVSGFRSEIFHNRFARSRWVKRSGETSNPNSI